MLGRRAVDLPLLLVVTYREAEVTADHPLRLVLGDLPRRPAAAVWLGLQPLSLRRRPGAGRAGTDAPAEEIHQLTGGNPFYVTEALAAPAETAVSTSVRLAVLAGGRCPDRRGTCSTPSQSFPGGRNGGWWTQCDPARNESTSASAVACSSAENGMYAFRHELARMGVELEMPDERRRALHRRAVAALRSAAGADPARIAHHAERGR